MDSGIEDLKTKMTRQRNFWRMRTFEDLVVMLRPSERLLLYILTALLSVSALVLLIGLNSSISITIPAQTGSLNEGVVGSPRFINPILAISQADEDLTQLIYSGLTRARPDGSIEADLAERYEISEDGMLYTFILREEATFHDGTPISAADVIFTIQTAQNPDIKSPRRADWEGVTVSSPDARTVVFKLPRAYAPFLENTSIGILPKHLWGAISAEEFPFHSLNTHPVGSGPFRLGSFETDDTGAATSYSLIPFEKCVRGKAFLKEINFRFYASESALVRAFNEGDVDSISSISPSALQELTRTKDSVITHVPLPRVFGAFFNQGRAPVLADASVRAALDAAVDKQALVDTILKGYGVPLSGPIPPGIFERATRISTSIGQTALTGGATSSAIHAERAREILRKGGWKYSESSGDWSKKSTTLSFALATGDTPELSATAQMLADFWEAAGIGVSIHVYPLSELNTNIIRPRAYDALLFGEVIGRTPDLFAFWHSSQRNDPGLNLAMYTNAQADKLLASARATTDRKEREELYRSFSETIAKDQPAIFLYAPDFVYIVPDNLRGVELGVLTLPSDRFLSAHEWYTDTERVWNFFTNETREI